MPVWVGSVFMAIGLSLLGALSTECALRAEALHPPQFNRANLHPARLRSAFEAMNVKKATPMSRLFLLCDFAWTLNDFLLRRGRNAAGTFSCLRQKLRTRNWPNDTSQRPFAFIRYFCACSSAATSIIDAGRSPLPSYAECYLAYYRVAGLGQLGGNLRLCRLR